MRKNVTPGSNKSDTKNNQPFVFEGFSRGTIQDPPASEISDALADSNNLTIYPGFIEGRTGNRLFTGTKFPHIAGRHHYAAHKEDSNIISDSGDIFLETDIGNYFCWGSTYELIIDYVDAQTVTTETSTYLAGADCSIMGAPNAFFWHKTLAQWVLLLGTEIYTAEWDIPSWNKLLTISRDEPFNSKSDDAEYRNYSFLFNGNGLFKSEIDASYPINYRVNIDPPNIKINSVPIFSGAVCKYNYIYSAARLSREGQIVDRQSHTEINLETGTNVADSENIDWAECYTAQEISSTNPNLVTELYVPVVANTNPLEYQWHFTHFPIWRTMNLTAKDPDDVSRTTYNDPHRFIWAKDLRICAAFYGVLTDHFFIASRGEFELADTYSILELDTGERFQILEWISATTVRIASDYYSYGTRGPYAAAIGNGRVIRGSVLGNILTRTHGATFTAADERKTLYNSDGYRLYITDYIDANHVEIHSDNGLPVQGFTLDPTHRKYYDVIEDTTLRARKDFYSCYSRYRSALPSCNLGKIIPGFMVEAYRGQKMVYYMNLQPKLDYMIGSYVLTQVSEEVQDAIQVFYFFQDILSILCASSTYGVALGLSEFQTLPGSNESIALLPGISIIDRHTGCLDPGSVQEVENGIIQLMTNEPGGEALRQFNGRQFSAENFLVDSTLGGRIMKALTKTKKMSAAIYDGFMGYILWRKTK
jgi:hypothetical protein